MLTFTLSIQPLYSAVIAFGNDGEELSILSEREYGQLLSVTRFVGESLGSYYKK